MPSYCLDENVSERLARALMDLGFDVTTVNRLGAKGADDATQLLSAAQAGRTFISHNVEDFILLQKAWISWSRAWNATAIARHFGILLLYPGKGVSVQRVAEVVAELSDAESHLENRLFTWNSAVGWRER
jgi:hypothetical protein